MRRLLLILPIALIVAGVAFGFFFLINTSAAPAPTASAVDFLDDSPVRPSRVNSPLETAQKPAPLADSPKYPDCLADPDWPVEAPKPEIPPEKKADPTLDAAKELLELLKSDALTEEEKKLQAETLAEAVAALREEMAKYNVTLKGTVYDYAGQPMAGAHIMIKSNEPTTRKRPAGARLIATTDAEGRFEAVITPQVQDDDTFDVEIHAFAPMALYSEVQKLSVTTGQTYSDLSFTMPQGAGITGRVVDQNFNPIAGASVAASITGLRDRRSSARPQGAKTDADGRFTITGLTAGNYTLTVSCTGFAIQGAWPAIDVVVGDPTILGSDIVMNTQTGLRVKLTCEAKQPTGRLTVRFFSGGTEISKSPAQADANGSALIMQIPVDATEITIEMRGYLATGKIAIAPVAGTHSEIGEVALTHNPEEEKLRKRSESSAEERNPRCMTYEESEAMNEVPPATPE